MELYFVIMAEICDFEFIFRFNGDSSLIKYKMSELGRILDLL